MLRCHVGGRDSNSFIQVAEADAILAALPDDTSSWAELDTAAKEYRLILAAAMMSYLPWKGTRTYRGQALCWPRSCFNSIPGEVREAQAQIAYTVVHRGLSQMPEVTESSPANDISSVSLGGMLSVSFGKKGTSGGVLQQLANSVYFPLYVRLSKYLLQVRGGSVGEVTASFATTTTTSVSSTCTTTSTMTV